MKSSFVVLALVVMSASLIAAPTGPDEGMWLLDAVGKLPLAQFKTHGYELTPEQILNGSGPCLKDAIVLLGGGTASFVSAEGLMVTNHHVAFGGIQQLSSVQDDYLKNGFWAKTKGEELSTNYTAQVVTEFRDVTTEVLAAVKEGMNPDERAKAITAKSGEIEKGATPDADHSARVSDMWSGVKYYLTVYRTISDVRLVYAPPGAIGNYGGETDNWIWPRHTGDFSLMRAYVGKDGKSAKYAKDNIPFTPKMFLPISAAGYTDGSFAMIMGFPGRTFRYRESAAVALARDESLPLTVDLYRTQMDIMENAWKNDRALQIKLASRYRGLANTYKNYLGTLEGMRRADVVSLKQREEENFATYLKSSAELTQKYGSLMADFRKANDEQKAINKKSIVANNLTARVDMLRLAARFRGQASPRDTAAPPGPRGPREGGNIHDFISGVFRTYDEGVDRQTMTALIMKALDLPAEQQFAAFREMAGSATGAARTKNVEQAVAELYEGTALRTAEGAEKLLAKGAADILDDPLVKLSVSVNAEIGPLNARMGKITLTLNALRAKYIEALVGWKKTTLVYPDANRTLRLTYGTVKPLRPRDAVEYRSMTTLTGVMEKETGEGDFIVPAKLKELWRKKDFGRYADPRTGDIPVAFLTNLDITGGNSGSPVINGKGELIGCAFDGNWEGVVGDYYFDEPLNRAISVDARYMLFVLDKFSGADNILKELTIK
jgi:hypothetical protein